MCADGAISVFPIDTDGDDDSYIFVSISVSQDGGKHDESYIFSLIRQQLRYTSKFLQNSYIVCIYYFLFLPQSACSTRRPEI